MTPARLARVVVLGAWLAAAPAAGQVASCDGPDADAWLTDFRDRVLSFDGLAAFAIGAFGPPVGCSGARTTEFDGVVFGHVELVLPRGVTLRVETMPPEASVETLTAPDGFEAPDEVVSELRAHAARIGLAVDWSAPDESTEDGERIRTFWDPDPGLNASASEVRRAGRLVAVRLSMAL